MFPVTPHGLLFVVTQGLDGSTLFREYRQYPDGSKGPAELNSLVRNVGDRVIAVDQVSTSQLSYGEVISLLPNWQNKKYITVRFQVSGGSSMMSSLPCDPSTGEPLAVPGSSAHLTEKTGHNKSTFKKTESKESRTVSPPSSIKHKHSENEEPTR